MIAMEKKCNFRKGFFAVLVAASAVVGCSKSNNDETPTPTDPASYYIELTTEKAVGEKIKLDVGADKADEAGVWLDLNGNGKWDEGIDLKPTRLYNSIEYSLQAQTFRIYGKVKILNCTGNELNALDISHNPALTNLYAVNNKISSIAHLEGIKDLKIDSHTLKNSLLPKGLSDLTVNETEGAPITNIDTSPFTELKSLFIINCKNLKSLDLSNNKKLMKRYIEGTSLTTLDLSQQPQLFQLEVYSTPLTKLNIEGNKALDYVVVQLTEEGDGLQGSALIDFINQLPTYKEGEEGNISLSPDQVTEEVKGLLEGKFWKVNLLD